MRIPVLFTVLLATVLAAAPLRKATAQEGEGAVSFSLFYDNLADDGDWYNTPEYGYVWQPDIAYKNDKWRPYSDGYWAQTDGGWTWVSYENFGWATYHYGRWTRLADIGWAWVPGYDWGPGWVSWRTSDDYVGWAPLPPKADRAVYEGKIVNRRVERAVAVDYSDVEDEDDGYTSDVDVDYDIGPDNYCFVETRSFGAPVLGEVFLPYERNVDYCERTTNVTNIYYERTENNVFVYNGGPDYGYISGRCERPIQRLQIERRRDPGFLALGLRAGGNPTQVHGGILQVAAPLIARRPVNFQQMKPPRIKQNLERSDVVHGWTRPGVDQQVTQRLRNHFKDQAQQAPAKAVLPKERLVQPLPVAQRIVTKSDLPPAPQKDMSPDAVAGRRAQRQQARAAQGNQTGPRPGQAGQNAQPPQPGQPEQPGANGPRRGAMTEADRVARRDAAQKARETREQTRGNGQPGQPGQAGPDGQPKDMSPDAVAARRAQRQQERAGQPGQAQAGAENPNQPGQPKDNSEDARAARRAQRQQERAGQQPQQANSPGEVQPGQAKPQNGDADREARRAQRQQERAAQQPAGPQQQAAPQPDAEREARRAQRQQERAAQPQHQQQAQPQPDADREARRAQRQQERAAQQQQQQQSQQADGEREARRAQRQQQQAEAQGQQRAQQQQANQERENQRGQRQQEQAQAAQQQQANQEREARRGQAQQQQQAAQQAQAQQQAQQQQQAGDADREARRAARQAEKAKKGDNPNQ